MSKKIIRQARPKSEIKPVTKDSKRHLIVMALAKGANIDDLMKLTGWSKEVARQGIFYDACLMLGYGVEREDKTYRLRLPKGMKAPLVSTTVGG